MRKDTDFGDINFDILTLVWYIVYIWYAFGIYRVRLYEFWCIRFYRCEFWYVDFSDMHFGIWKILTSVIYFNFDILYIYREILMNIWILVYEFIYWHQWYEFLYINFSEKRWLDIYLNRLSQVGAIVLLEHSNQGCRMYRSIILT